MFLWLGQIDECREYFRVNVKILALNGLAVSVVSLRLLLPGQKAIFLCYPRVKVHLGMI